MEFSSNPYKSPIHRQLFYQELLMHGLTPEEIALGPDKVSDSRLQELKLTRKGT